MTGVSVRSYPTLIWYPKDNKKGVSYTGGRELADFKDFFNQNSEAYKNWAASQGGSEQVTDEL